MTLLDEALFVTADEFLEMPDSVAFELVDGQLVERNLGAKSSRIAMRIGHFFEDHLEDDPVAHVFGSDATYKCFPDDPEMYRRADVSVILKSRLPGGQPPAGVIDIPPDVAVEVVSPNDLWYEVSSKVELYLSAGYRIVWVADPSTKQVHVHGLEIRPTVLKADDTIDLPDILPGFSRRVGDFFAA